MITALKGIILHIIFGVQVNPKVCRFVRFHVCGLLWSGILLPICMVVKIMVPFWDPYYNTGPNTGPNLGDPKRDHNFDNHPYVFISFFPFAVAPEVQHKMV